MSIHWSPHNEQRILTLVDTEADSSLSYGNPDSLNHCLYTQLLGKTIKTRTVTPPLGIGHLSPRPYNMYLSLVPEYIVGVDVVQRFNLQQTSAGEFHLQV